MQGQSGGGMSMRRGFPIAGSTKQKLNSWSSTETEIDYFLEAQGYNVQDNCLHQANNSSIILEKNGKTLSSKRTNHINILYLFITDRVAKGEVSIVWWPTEYMIADYMTKSFRYQIMGVVPEQDPGPGKAKVSKTKSEWRLRQWNKV